MVRCIIFPCSLRRQGADANSTLYYLPPNFWMKSSAIPTTMRYISHGDGGGPEVLRVVQAPIPAIGPREVLIQVHFAGVNRPDLLQRSGKYPPPPDASPILGLEVAGRGAARGGGGTAWGIRDQGLPV